MCVCMMFILVSIPRGRLIFNARDEDLSVNYIPQMHVESKSVFHRGMDASVR